MSRFVARSNTELLNAAFAVMMPVGRNRLSMVLQESQFDELDRRVAALEKGEDAARKEAFLTEWVRVCVRVVAKVAPVSACPGLGRQSNNEPYVGVNTFSGYVCSHTISCSLLPCDTHTHTHTHTHFDTHARNKHAHLRTHTVYI